MVHGRLKVGSPISTLEDEGHERGIKSLTHVFVGCCSGIAGRGENALEGEIEVISTPF